MKSFEYKQIQAPVQYRFIVHHLLATILWRFDAAAEKITLWLSIRSRFKQEESHFYKNKVAILECFKQTEIKKQHLR